MQRTFSATKFWWNRLQNDNIRVKIRTMKSISQRWRSKINLFFDNLADNKWNLLHPWCVRRRWLSHLTLTSFGGGDYRNESQTRQLNQGTPVRPVIMGVNNRAGEGRSTGGRRVECTLSRRPQRHNRSSSANGVKEIQILYTSVYRPQQMINEKCKAGLLSGDELIASGLDHRSTRCIRWRLQWWAGEGGRFSTAETFLHQHHFNIKSTC